MSDKRRSVFDIMRDILEVCVKPKNKTRVVYTANLNSIRINEYLDSLVKMGLLAKVPKGKTVGYHTTETGLKFLESYRKGDITNSLVIQEETKPD
jgi:predicted transcriptional regulator